MNRRGARRACTGAGRVLGVVLAALCGLSASGTAFAQVDARTCGPIRVQGDFGPYDYRTDKFYLPVVENAHFTPSVEMLIRGKTGQRVEPDLDYTLRKFPNHHRALLALLRHSTALKMLVMPYLPLPVECYFERAVRFRDDDTVARMIYVQFMIQHKRLDEARAHLRTAESMAGPNLLTLRNVGLLYAEMGEFDEARRLAYRLLSGDPADPVLRDRLVEKGQWREPSQAEREAAQAASAASAAASAGS